MSIGHGFVSEEALVGTGAQNEKTLQDRDSLVASLCYFFYITVSYLFCASRVLT